jgi:hypothetical protein
MNSFKPAIPRFFFLGMLLCLLPVAACAAAVSLPSTQLLPVVPGDPETRSTPFIAWFMDLSLDGYVEEEYAVSGLANIYGYVDDASESPAVEVIEADVPYTSRILVRRPEDPGRFNGTVFLEVLNATAGWDGDPIWQSNFEYLTREGAVWVGMSTKPVTVNFLRDGWAAWPLVTRNASRYVSMSMPHFGQVWDMLNQTGLLLKTSAAADNPLAGFDVERIVMVGYSQSAAYQVTQSESDNPALRFYEMAGGSHVDAQINMVGGQALVRDLGLQPSFCPDPLFPYNPIIIGYVQSALMDGLGQWISHGTEPPASRFVDLLFPGGVAKIALDADGNAVGRVRPPQIEVPLGRYLPNNSGPGFCFLFGGFDAFDDETLSDRYPNHGIYVNQMTRAIKRSEEEGFLLREDAATQRRDAAR